MPINWIQYPDSSLFNTGDKIIVSEPSGNTKNLSFPFTSNSSGITFTSDIYFTNLAEVEHEFSVMVGPDGKLTKSTHPGERSRIKIRNDEGTTIPAGAPIYSKGEVGGSERILVGICDSSDPAKMPCIGIVETELNTTDNKDGFATTQGVYNTNISGFTGLSEGDILYVNGGSAPHLTQTKPTSGDLIQNVGVVIKTNGTICQGLLVAAIGRTNDVPWPLYVDHTNQRVGIGTSSPAKKLTVTTSTTGDGILGITSDGNDWFRVQNDNSTAFPVGTFRLYYGTNQNVKITALSNEMKLGDSQNNMTFFTASSERMRLTNTGQLGIGTTSPSQLIDVASSGTNTNAPTFRITNTANNSASNWNGKISHAIEFYSTDPSRVGLASSIQNIAGTDKGGVLTGNITFNTADWPTGGIHERMRITDSGNVGINQATPTEKLHVVGNAIITGDLTVSGTTTTINTTNLNIEDKNITLNYSTGDSSSTADGAGITIQDAVNSTTDATILWDATNDKFDFSHGATFTNNVGIGTSSPDAILHVKDVNPRIIKLQDANYTNQYATIGFDDGHLKFSSDPDSQRANSVILFKIDNSEKMRLTNTGKLGVGLTNPDAKVEIVGANNTTDMDVLHISNSNNIAKIKLGYDTNSHGRIDIIDGDNNVDIRLSTNTASYINNGQNFGIGTASPSYPLDVNGNIRATAYRIGGATILSGDATVNLGSAGATGFITFTTTSGEGMRLSGSNLLIGTTTDDGSSKLQVAGNLLLDSKYKFSIINTDLYLTDASNSHTVKIYQDGQFGSHIWYVNNSEKMRLTSSGNVGIGTTSPQKLLEVKSSSAYNSTLRLQTSLHNWDIQGGETGYSSTAFAIDYDGTTFFRAIGTTDSRFSSGLSIGSISTAPPTSGLYVSGNVGIGTTSPAYKLDVVGEGKVTGKFRVGGAVMLAEPGTGVLLFGSEGGNQTAIYSASQERIRIDSSGNVGIGQTSPAHKLDVAGYIRSANTGADSNTKYSQFLGRHYTNSEQDILAISTESTSSNNNIYVGGGFSSRNSATTIRFSTASNNTTTTGSERMRITSGGNVLIGTTTDNGDILQIGVANSDPGFVTDPNVATTISSITNGDEVALQLFVNDGTNNIRSKYFVDDTELLAGFDVTYSTGLNGFAFKMIGSEKMRLSTNGNLLIGTTTDNGEKLQVAGNLLLKNTSNTNLLLRNAGGSNNALIFWQKSTGSDEWYFGQTNENDDIKIYNYDNDSFHVIFKKSGNTEFQSGNVLIGTTTDSGAKLNLQGNLQVGVDDTGYDVTFYGATSGRYLHWDESDNALELTDNTYLKLGTGNDLQIYHNATDSKIDNYTGDLYITNFADDKDIIFRSDDGAGGFETYFYLDGSASSGEPYTVWPDSSIAAWGTGVDFRIKHDGSNTYLYNTTGHAYFINYADDKDIIFQSDDGSGGVTEYFRLDGSEGHTVASKEINFLDGIAATFGNKAGGDLEIKEQSGNSYISNFTGNLEIINHANDSDIIFKSDDGSGGVTPYITLDGSQTTINLQKTVLIGTTTNTGAYKIDVAGKQRVQDTLELDDVLMLNQISTPADPAAGKSVIYMDSADGGIKCKINVGGTVVTRTLASFE
jgi:hypothetical protein